MFDGLFVSKDAPDVRCCCLQIVKQLSHLRMPHSTVQYRSTVQCSAVHTVEENVRKKTTSAVIRVRATAQLHIVGDVP